jgi:hypothetical protein
MTNHINNPWDDARVDQLISLFQTGMSASHIARVMGKPFTRNSVIGKLHRLRAAGKVGAAINPPHKPTSKAMPRPKKWQAPKVKIKRVPPPPPVVYAKPTSEYAVTIADLKPGQCRFIEGEYRSGDMAEAMCCGAPALDNRSYCGHHHTLSYIPYAKNSRFERSFMYFARQR